MGDGRDLITMERVHMEYPVPRRIRHFVLRPFARPDRVAALTDVSLSVNRGDRVAILGPNGAGKTSLLKLIGGLLLPTRGRISFRGRDMADNLRQIRRAVGLVMNEERSFYWRLTGRQNLEFFGALDNLGARALRERIGELTAVVGLQGHLDKRVASYSSGMRQRLAIVRGLLADPEVLILDEPTRTLDPIAAEEHVDFLIQRIHADFDKTLLVATHKLQEAERLCTRFCVINGGRVMAHTDIESLRRDHRTLEHFYRAAVAKEAV